MYAKLVMSESGSVVRPQFPDKRKTCFCRLKLYRNMQISSNRASSCHLQVDSPCGTTRGRRWGAHPIKIVELAACEINVSCKLRGCPMN